MLGYSKKPFPSIAHDATRFMSLIVPAYNEEERMEEMLNDMVPYLKQREHEDGYAAGLLALTTCTLWHALPLPARPSLPPTHLTRTPMCVTIGSQLLHLGDHCS